jgi:hypothetical protein
VTQDLRFGKARGTLSGRVFGPGALRRPLKMYIESRGPGALARIRDDSQVISNVVTLN